MNQSDYLELIDMVRNNGSTHLYDIINKVNNDNYTNYGVIGKMCYSLGPDISRDITYDIDLFLLLRGGGVYTNVANGIQKFFHNPKVKSMGTKLTKHSKEFAKGVVGIDSDSPTAKFGKSTRKFVVKHGEKLAPVAAEAVATGLVAATVASEGNRLKSGLDVGTKSAKKGLAKQYLNKEEKIEKTQKVLRDSTKEMYVCKEGEEPADWHFSKNGVNYSCNKLKNA